MTRARNRANGPGGQPGGTAPAGADTPRFRVAFVRLFALRLFGTVSLRFPYPFLATIADDMDISIGSLGLALAAGEAVGMASPLLGRRMDVLGRRRGMFDGVVLGAIGCAVVAAAPGAVVFGAGFAALALGRYLFDVSFGAWVGDEVNFERRGFVSGIGELAWSGSFLIGVPVAGVVAAAFSWRLPYVAFVIVQVAALVLVWRTLPPHDGARVQGTAPAPPVGAVIAEPNLRGRGAVRMADAGPRVPFRAIHAAIFCLGLGAAFVFATEGPWFELGLSMSESAVSVAVFVLGAGELIGALGSALLADRLGKQRTMVLGIALLVPALAGVVLTGSTVWVGVAAAFVVGLGFELAFVSALPLVVELEPRRRASALSLAVAALTGARMLAVGLGPGLFDAHGMTVIVALAAPPVLAAGVIVSRFVRDPASVVAEA